MYESALGELSARSAKREVKPRYEGKKPKTWLTPRQTQIITLVGLGYTNSEIAGFLGLSENTVKVYLSRVFMGIPRTLMPILALQNGLTTLKDIDDRLAQLTTEKNAWFIGPKLAAR